MSEKWNFTEPMKIDDANGYASDVYEGKVSNMQNDICQVWGTSEAQINERLKIISKAPEMLEALKTLLQCYIDECRIPNVKVIHETKSLLKELS